MADTIKSVRAVTDTLLQMVRNYLDITWEDPAGDEKLKGIIARGMSYIDNIAGISIDYESPETTEDLSAQGLFYNYCQYERAEKLDEFQKNYKSELLLLQLMERAYADGGLSGAEDTDVS
jgi:hypothetical protein